jgi:hypothetical protein
MVHLYFSFSMAHLQLLKEVTSLPKLSLASSHLEYFDWEGSLVDFFHGHRLQQPEIYYEEIYYAAKTLANDVFYWWIEYDKKFPSWTWNDIKAMLRRQFAPPIESKKKVAIVHAQNPQGTMENVRLSWADSIAGNEYLPASNRQVVDITSHKKLGSGATYGKSTHAEMFSPPKLKQATGQSNCGERLSAFARSSLGPKKKSVAAKEILYTANQKFMVPVKKLEASSSAFSCATPPERKYASSISEISSHPPENSKEVAVAEKEMEEKSIEPLIDIVDDATNGLSMLAREVESNGTVVHVKV